MTGFQVDPLGPLLRGMDGHHFLFEEDVPFKCVDGNTIVCLSGAKVGRIMHRVITEQTDGASTPKPLWGTGLPPFGWYWLPTAGHDCGYRMFTHPILDKQQSDAFLLEAMESMHEWALAHGVTEEQYQEQKFAIYHGVVLFGEQAFLDDRTQRA